MRMRLNTQSKKPSHHRESDRLGGHHMRIIKGKGVVPEIAVGRFFMLDKKDAGAGITPSQSCTADISAELELFRTAANTAAKEFESLAIIAKDRAGDAEAEIFETHRLMLLDDDLSGEAEVLIKEGQSAISAIRISGDRLKAMLLGSDSDYMRQRAADVEAVCGKLLEILSRGTGEIKLTVPAVIGAFDLTPAQTLTLDRDMVLGFVTGAGGSSSHTAILARSMNIPAVVGAGEIPEEADGATVILDGCEGLLIISPDEDTLNIYKNRMEEKIAERKALEAMSDVSVSYKGKKIRICANIADHAEAEKARLSGADGIGLFRSEFLYMKYGRPPTEDEQLEAYKAAAMGVGRGDVIIRTLDAGADKDIPYLGMKKEPNPALGLRAIRLCLRREELFCKQLKALLRASAKENISILLPMITGAEELLTAKKIIERIKGELARDGIAFDPDTPVGVMIETPSAAIIADRLAENADFFSVGTNDLIQYTMAADRQNSDVSYLCDGVPESVMRLLANIGSCAENAGIWAGICGELAADTDLTEFFLESGYTELSVSPPHITRIKKKISELSGASVKAFRHDGKTHMT